MKPVIASLALTFSFPIWGETTYVVGVEQADFLPHYRGDEKGNYQGFGRELLDNFVAHTGVSLTLRVMPADALLPALLAGEIDAKYPDSPTWSTQAKAGALLQYSLPVVNYVDGVMVLPRRVGLGINQLRRLAIVDGWTPRGYEDRIGTNQISLVGSKELPHMVRQTLLKDTDGAYYNVVVAAYYLNNIRAKPGALTFDAGLPHTRGTYHLSSMGHPELIERFDRFLADRRVEVSSLKDKHQVEASLTSEYIGMEQWKVDFLERQKLKRTSDE
ncbi:transporter substrate-binding domain-containing protein [Pseudomonas sp. NPDC047963]|nr:transporter substrate-binding domain-containing protein [Pseudomonas sp.]